MSLNELPSDQSEPQPVRFKPVDGMHFLAPDQRIRVTGNVSRRIIVTGEKARRISQEEFATAMGLAKPPATTEQGEATE